MTATCPAEEHHGVVACDRDDDPEVAAAARGVADRQ